MCLLSVSKPRRARVSVQREGEVETEKRRGRDKRPERVHSTGAAGVGRCRSPRTQTVLGRGYRADLRRLGVGGLVGSRALNTICMHRPTLKRGGEAYTCTAPTASAPSCRTTDHAPAAAPLRAIYICSRFCSFYFSATFLLITFKRLQDTFHVIERESYKLK